MSDKFKKRPIFTKEKSEILRKTLDRFDDEVKVDPLSEEERTELTSLQDRTFLLHVLIEALCCMVEEDEYKRKKLFNRIYKDLEANKVIHSAIDVDSLAQSRRTAALQFYDHIKQVHRTISPHLDEEIYKTNESNLPISKLEKYEDTFDEVEVIAKGAFGTVCKARHKVDYAIYAVKKIIFEYQRDSDYIKVMREARNLSSLSYIHIVSYNNAWIQPADQNDLNSKKMEWDSSYTEDQSTEFSYDQSWGDSNVASSNTNNLSTFSESSSIIFTDDLNDSQSCLATKYEAKSNRNTMSDESDSIIFQNYSKSSHTNSLSSLPNLPILKIKMMLCIQMEFCDYDLSHWLDARNEGCPLPFSKSIPDIFKEILCGVAHIHEKGIIHRDLKPKNIFYSKEQKVMKVGDFGLATLSHNPPDEGQDLSEHSTNLGTLPYAAPEQLSLSDYDSRVDMYSLGIILIELLVKINTRMELDKIIKNIKKGLMPQEITEEWPEYIPLLTNLLQDKHTVRMHVKEVLDMPLFKDKKEGNDLEQKIKDLERELANKEKEIQELQEEKQIMEQNFQEEMQIMKQNFQEEMQIMKQNFQEEIQVLKEALIDKERTLQEVSKEVKLLHETLNRLM